MSNSLDTQFVPAAVTDGNIALINLESARVQAWSRFRRVPTHASFAAIVADHELLAAQFCGDPCTLDRLESLVVECARASPDASETALVAAHVAGALHRFDEARAHLARASSLGAVADGIARATLALDQATGTDPERVLAARLRRIESAARWEDWIPLAALLADLGEWDDAERTFHRALHAYRDVSPFGPAWVCFELGMLLGERVPSPDPARAAAWYRKAIDCVPAYARARVHLAEILLDSGDLDAARAALEPALASGDPEAAWRRAEIEAAASNAEAAAAWSMTARDTFERLLDRYPLAFADHGVEFYLSLGDDPARALELARLNLANRPTLRAHEQTWSAAIAAGESGFAAAIAAAAAEHWSGLTAFRDSSFATSDGVDASRENVGEDSAHART